MYLYRLHIWHRNRWVKGGYFFGTEDAEKFLASFFDEDITWQSAKFQDGKIFVGKVDYKPAYYLLQEQEIKVANASEESSVALPCSICHKVFTGQNERKAQLALNAHMRVHKAK